MMPLERQYCAAGDLSALQAVPVLTYHSVDDSNSVISVAPKLFRRQMHLLRDWGFHAIRLRDLLDSWEERRPLPSRPVVLTFDDGFGNLCEHAIPVLAELGFRATIFAVAGHCGGKNDWPSQSSGVPRLPLLSWSELRELAGVGFEVGAHGIMHAPLPMLGQREAEWEIAGAKQILQEHLGQEVSVFAYPYGLATAAHRRMAGVHYRTACGTHLGTARPSDDRCWLPRVEMHYYRALGLFHLFPTDFGRAYLRLRAVGRACRHLLCLT